MELDYDYIICGGGISGLLLALKFSNDSYYKDKSILILDPDFPKKSNDRTLCFWDKKNSCTFPLVLLSGLASYKTSLISPKTTA